MKRDITARLSRHFRNYTISRYYNKSVCAHAVSSDVEIFMCGVYSERTFIRQALNLRTVSEHNVIPLS